MLQLILSAVFCLAALTSVWAQSPLPSQGRLTLISGVPVMTPVLGGGSGGVAGATTIFHTPYGGQNVPIYDGAQFVNKNCPEISNVIGNSAVGNAGPSAVVPNAVYDLFVWDNSGCVLTRGDFWQQQVTVTNTNASPAVFTQTDHGMGNGTPVRLNCVGGGSLSPGFTANQTYFTVSVAPNTFDLAATPGGVAINAGGASTCVTSQQATEALGGPVQNLTTAPSRGIAPAVTRTNGVLVNNVSITNGPAATRGTYVGTIATNASGTVDYKFGGAVPGGSAASFMVWNNYNRKLQGTSVIDTAPAYTYSGSAVRMANNSPENLMSFLQGQREDSVCAHYIQQVKTTANSGAYGAFSIGFDIVVVDTPPFVVEAETATVHTASGGIAMCHQQHTIGWHRWIALEQGDGTHANSFGATGVFTPGGALSMELMN